MPGERQAPQGILAFMTMRSARARLCTAEKPPSLWAGSQTTQAPSAGVSTPASLMEPETRSRATGRFPAAGGVSSQVLSVFPAEKKASPGSNYDQVVNICWLNGVLSTGRLRSQPQPWKVQFSGLGKGEGKGLPTLFRGVCPGYVPCRSLGVHPPGAGGGCGITPLHWGGDTWVSQALSKGRSPLELPVLPFSW